MQTFCPSGKQIYPSERWAHQMAQDANQRRSHRLYVYSCPECGYFHTTSRRQRAVNCEGVNDVADNQAGDHRPAQDGDPSRPATHSNHNPPQGAGVRSQSALRSAAVRGRLHRREHLVSPELEETHLDR